MVSGMVMGIITVGDASPREDIQGGSTRRENFSVEMQQCLMKHWGTFASLISNVVDGETSIIMYVMSIIGQIPWELKLAGVSTQNTGKASFK